MPDFLKKRKLRKFGEVVVEKKANFFIFGSNVFTESFIQQLLRLGMTERLVLVTDSELLWTEELEEKILVLTEQKKAEYSKEEFYESIALDNAERIIILHEDAQLIENIVSLAFMVAKDARIIVLSRFATPFVKYLSSSHNRVVIADDVTRVVQDLYKTLELGLVMPSVIQIAIQPALLGKKPLDFHIKDCSFLRVVRKTTNVKILNNPFWIKDELYPVDTALQEGDEILVYLKNMDALKYLVEFYDQLATNNKKAI